ncbi:response regulator [Roseovarius sp. SK2]|uniref:response regulator n=1 Tax=Roseovarius sp. SK2 TaxID=3028381 RepID=UPI00237B8748|nr:response regulator [Roseovarius sp. SK2]MDD9727562.1 response regulator [Roseovarius sp. SK2]
MTKTGVGSQGTILCVEDERHLRQDIVEELVAAGYKAIGAANGREALTILETVRPDLILCDISMPGIDGYGVLRYFREIRQDLANVPFVFLTALGGRDAIIDGKRMGADDYLVKPIDYDLMLATVEARLREVVRIDKRFDQLRDALSDAGSGNPADISRMVNVLDLLSFGVVLLSSNEVLHANRMAQDIHSSEDGISIDTTIHAASARITADIRARWKSACKAACENREELSSLSIPRQSGKQSFHLTLCALPGSHYRQEGGVQTVAFIIDPLHRPAIPTGILSGLFDLTPTEAEVARALARGMRTDEIATELAIAPTTVAFHLRNLFDKTGTRRQADLIALLLTGLASISPA